ncbi:hypothetical protein ACOSQ3_002484 [Xanthoceras sorbifolium]
MRDKVVVSEEVEDSDNHQLFEDYQSNNSDVFNNDSEKESPQSMMDKMMKGKPFRQMIEGAIKFVVGQTHNNIYSLKHLLREYVIQEGINLDRVKNGKNRLTYKCK